MSTPRLKNPVNGQFLPKASGFVDHGDHFVTATGKKIAKTDRYGWKLADEPGAFEWIDKNRLQIDEHYQREQTPTKVMAMAQNWSWIACGTLTVALRPDGSLFVVDGGHRKLASDKRADITQLPCMIYDAESVAKEATGFLAANTLRRSVQMVEKFKALLVTGDRIANHMQELANKYNYIIGPSGQGRHFRCIGRAMYLYEQNAEIFDRCFDLAVDICDGNAIHERVLDPVVCIEAKLAKQNSETSLTKQPWRGRCVSLGTQGFVDAVAKASAMYARGGSAIWAKGIVAALNRGVRNRLEIGGFTDAD